MDKKQIVRAFVPFFKEHGYKKWGTNRFYKIENDIAFCFLFERPSIIVYPTYFIWPLYMPTDKVVCLNYGHRLSKNRHGISSYYMDDDDSAFVPWVEKVKLCFESIIFPFYESVNSPEKLWQFLNREDVWTPDYFFSDPMKIAELKMYTSCFLGDLANTRKQMDLIRQEINDHQYFEYFKNIMMEKLNWVEEIMASPQEVREAIFRDIIRTNKETVWRIRQQEN